MANRARPNPSSRRATGALFNEHRKVEWVMILAPFLWGVMSAIDRCRSAREPDIRCASPVACARGREGPT